MVFVVLVDTIAVVLSLEMVLAPPIDPILLPDRVGAGRYRDAIVSPSSVDLVFITSGVQFSVRKKTP